MYVEGYRDIVHKGQLFSRTLSGTLNKPLTTHTKWFSRPVIHTYNFELPRGTSEKLKSFHINFFETFKRYDYSL